MLLEEGLSLQDIVFIIISIITAFTIHEFAHAATAYLLGDSTARNQGRLTLNPIVHLDIIGSIMILLAGFGWAKPVEVNPHNFKNPKRDDLLVSLAGPASNFLLAFVLAKLYFFSIPESYDGLLSTAIYINMVLAIFNLLPIPPLDGSRIIPSLLPASAQNTWATFEQYSMVIFIALIFSGVTGLIIDYPVQMALDFAYLGVP
ncbi:MAG: site-2 protease family protein [Candidatus Aquicultor sp.]